MGKRRGERRRGRQRGWGERGEVGRVVEWRQGK